MHSRGWIRLERFIQLKKLLSIRSIIAMGGEDVVKIMFMERFQAIKNSGGTDVDSFDDSIVFDLLGTASMFNLSEEVLDMVERGHIYDKVAWKKIVWAQAWSLEDTLWKIEYNLQIPAQDTLHGGHCRTNSLN